MMQHLPALLIVVPLLAAPICVLLGRGRFAHGFTLAVTWVTFAMSALLLHTVLESGAISYHLGGWAPPWGIEYRIDPVNAYVLLIVSAIGALVMSYARASIDRELGRRREYLFYTTYLLCLTGLLGVTITGDAFNIFVFFEISSLASYILISLGSDRRALTAAFNYLIFGTIGATFFLIGVGLLYQMTGTLNIADLAERVPPLTGNRTVQAAFIFMAVGLALKAAIFPLHSWLPNAYAYAPSVVTAFLAATATKVAIYVLIRSYFTIFGPDFSFGPMSLGVVLMVPAVAAMLVGSMIAMFQDDIKRMLAYSSVAQIGYMVLGIGFATVLGVTGGMLHLFNHALIKAALFLAMGCVFYRMGSVRIEAMAGLGKRMPWTMAAFVGGGLSLIGVPLTAGFVSKWYLLLAALDSGMWWIAIFILISSLMAIIYIWRVVEVAYFSPSPEGAPEGEAPLSMLIPTWTLVLANFYFGIDTRVSVGAATRAAEYLLGAGS
ncbi:monovalent cation/H+ antiporter subunit D family protein [bacterium AH-315-B06]|nr:monovalent cation/H+ antiporter subunit D family protein [bacterium AH-315-B06]